MGRRGTGTGSGRTGGSSRWAPWSPRPSSPGSSSGPCAARSAGPPVRGGDAHAGGLDQAKAEAAALLDAAVLSFAEGHLGTALELGDRPSASGPSTRRPSGSPRRPCRRPPPWSRARRPGPRRRRRRCWRGPRRARPPGASTAPGRGCCSSATPTRWGSSGSGTARPGSGRSCCGTPSGAGAPRRPWSSCRAPPPSSPRWGRGPRRWPPRRRSSPSSPPRRRSWRRTTPAGSPAPTRRASPSPAPGWTAPATCSTKPTSSAAGRCRRRRRRRRSPSAGGGAPGRRSAPAPRGRPGGARPARTNRVPAMKGESCCVCTAGRG